MATTPLSYCARPQQYLFRFNRAEKRRINDVITTRKGRKNRARRRPYSRNLSQIALLTWKWKFNEKDEISSESRNCRGHAVWYASERRHDDLLQKLNRDTYKTGAFHCELYDTATVDAEVDKIVGGQFVTYKELF
ncbi:hypothetical protein TcasGA2_TC012720 [Tribolium castaneum]|uniref:Uncharacterized protein n=1 Tax=Tribolium castaneum TaxID=7070 RepID=D6WZT2_TRICA|nr:hypothetical protein TcasGA2_TC012720 [Tribolium castaneum]